MVSAWATLNASKIAPFLPSTEPKVTPEDAASNDEPDADSKKWRSCDVCRRRKVRCDAAQVAQGDKCSRCQASDVDCTYTASGKERNVSAFTRIQRLEQRHQVLQAMLKHFLPDADLSGDFDADEVANLMIAPKAWEEEILSMCRSTAEYFEWEENGEKFFHDDAEAVPAYLRSRFCGGSSQDTLVKFMLEWKAHQQDDGATPKPSELQTRMPLDGSDSETLPWEERHLSPCIEIPSSLFFPDDDLMSSLTHLYFANVNLFMPLLHRPTFDHNIKVNLHQKDASFGRVVLLVCAVGARFSDDPRVLSEGTHSRLSSGWKWFNQVQHLEERLLAPPSLYDIQAYCLSAEFLRGASSNPVFWTLLGIGLRRAQNVGIHRWETFGSEKSAERELWVRAWWCLVVLNRLASAAAGQCMSASYSYDFDVGLPTECDDEFWDHPDPEQAWKQPPGPPSKVSFFISFIKQTSILATVLEFEYANNKARLLYMSDMYKDMERKLIMELDSALNKWIDSIPEHLRNPQRQDNSIFHRQSIVLHAELYFLQILIHRPFLGSGDAAASSLTTYSIAICTNAARACSRLFDSQSSGWQDVVSRIQWPIFSASVALLLSVWSGKRMGFKGTYPKEMHNVEKCVTMLQQSENCWQSSGQLVDMIQSLVTASDLSFPPPKPIHRSQLGLDLSDASRRSEAATPSDPAQCSVFDDRMPLSTADLANIPMYSRPSLPSAGMDPHGCLDPTPHLPDGGIFGLNLASFNRLNTVTSAPSTSVPQGASFYQPVIPPTVSLPNSDTPQILGLDPGPMPPDIFDLDTLSMWTNAPRGLNVKEWGTYLDNVNETQMATGSGQMRMPWMKMSTRDLGN